MAFVHAVYLRCTAPKDITRFGLTLYCSNCMIATTHGVGRKARTGRANRMSKSEVAPDTTP